MPTRSRRLHGAGKDDASDTPGAARQAVSGEDFAVPKSQDGWVEEVRALYVAREGLVHACTSLADLALASARKAPDEVRPRLEPVGTVGIMRACACWEGGDGSHPVAGATMVTLWAAWLRVGLH